MEEAERLNRQLIQLYQRGNYAEAARLGERVLAIREKVLGPEHPDTATSLNTLAGLYWNMGEMAKALPLGQRTVVIREKVLGLEHLTTAKSLYNLAMVYKSMEEYAQALRFFQRELATEPRTFANAFAVASEAQKLRFVQESQWPYLAALSLIQRRFQGDVPAMRFGLELVLWRKGIVLEVQSQGQKALAATLEGKPLEAWQRLTQHRSTLAGLLLRGPGAQSSTDYRRVIVELSASIAREEEFLAQRSGLLAQILVPRQVTAYMVAKRLPRDGALVEFVRMRDWDEAKKGWADTDRYLAFILAPDSLVSLVDLGEAELIDTAISKALALIDSSAHPLHLKARAREADAALSDLYGLLLQPLDSTLGALQRLILSPDGELNKVPFAALRTPDGR